MLLQKYELFLISPKVSPLFSLHFQNKAVFLVLGIRIFVKVIAHQLGDVRTTRAVRVHISCCASAHQLLCGQRTYIFRRFIFSLPAFFIGSSKDLNEKSRLQICTANGSFHIICYLFSSFSLIISSARFNALLIWSVIFSLPSKL